MKRVKQFLLVITGVSLFFITGCTTTQNIPYDDVYYSTTKGSPQYLVARTSNTTATEPSHYKVEKVEAVNTSGQNSKSTVNQKQKGYQVDTLKTNNIDSVTYSKINTGLGFDNSNFGTGIYSWSLGGGGVFGFNNFWYDPYWSNFYYPYSYPYYNWGWNPYYSWNYPYYGYGGWGLYSYGYPYWGFGFNYPYYGYYGYYGYGYPYTYFSPYHNWYRNRYYGHRGGSSLRGSSIPFSGSTVPLVGTKSARSERRSSVTRPSGIRSSGTLKNTSSTVRTSRSMQYQKTQNNVKATRVGNTGGHMLRKPPVYRPNSSTTQQRQNQERSFYRRPANMTTPRYQKPKQYQSLDTRQARSSNEYFRPQPQTIIHGKATRVNTRRTPQRFNIYRPNNIRSNYRRPVYRNSWIRTSRSTPVRHFNNTPQRFYSSPQFNRGNENNTRTYSPPARIRTGGGNSGGGGNRGGGGGNIRR